MSDAEDSDMALRLSILRSQRQKTVWADGLASPR